MFGLAKQKDVEDVLNQNIHLARRIKLLEKHLGLTYSGGEKRRAHYKKAGKVGRPRKTDDMPRE